MVSAEESVKGERFSFSADIKKLLGLIINTFYSNKEVFLREAISNASDAIDKIRFESLTDPSVLKDDADFKIQIELDKENNILTLRDNGIGMTKDEMVTNLGTIATSGTKSFMDAIKAGADIQMIGKFGVGFYSVFLVSSKVEVRSKHNGDVQHVWESTAGGDFDIYDDSKNEYQLTRGTELILHLKKDQQEFVEERRIEEIIHKHSEFLGKKIFLKKIKEEEKDVTDDEEDEEDKKEGDENTKEDEEKKEKDKVKIEEVKDEDEEKTKKTKKVKEVTTEWVQVNKSMPIWSMKPEDVKEEEYNTFYKSISTDWEKPLVYKHFHIEGQVQFSGILFIPKRAPFDLFNSDKKHNNIKLYVRRVFINDDAKDLCPEYLSFIRGVVDSEDMPLNISRETLQQNKMMKVIKKHVIKKALEMIEELMENKEDFNTFYKHFAKNLKLGVHEDPANRAQLASLLRFHTSKSGDDFKTLKEYVAEMDKNQKDIYYIAGDSVEALRKMPFLEKLVVKGLEVIFMTEPIDEYFVQQLNEFEGHKVVSITKEGLELPQTESEKEEFEKKKKDLEPFCKRVKEILGARVEKVEVSSRLTDSPCCISTARFGWNSRMEQIMKNQALRDTSFTSNMSAKKILEVNVDNSIIQKLSCKLAEDTNDPVAKNLVFLIYDTAVLTSGGLSLDNPVEYAERIFKLTRLGLNIVNEEAEDELPKLEEVPAEASEVAEMEEVD